MIEVVEVYISNHLTLRWFLHPSTFSHIYICLSLFLIQSNVSFKSRDLSNPSYWVFIKTLGMHLHFHNDKFPNDVTCNCNFEIKFTAQMSKVDFFVQTLLSKIGHLLYVLGVRPVSFHPWRDVNLKSFYFPPLSRIYIYIYIYTFTFSLSLSL